MEPSERNKKPHNSLCMSLPFLEEGEGFVCSSVTGFEAVRWPVLTPTCSQKFYIVTLHPPAIVNVYSVWFVGLSFLPLAHKKYEKNNISRTLLCVYTQLTERELWPQTAVSGLVQPHTSRVQRSHYSRVPHPLSEGRGLVVVV